MTFEEIERLAHSCAAAGIGEIELAEGSFALRLSIAVASQTPVASPAPVPFSAPPTDAAAPSVRAPGVGVFRSVHPTTGRPVVEIGQRVRLGDTVGVLQVGALLRAVTAPADGVLGSALTEDGAVVGYGTPLYELKPSQGQS